MSTPRSYLHRAFGLTIRSPLELWPETRDEGTGALADVEIAISAAAPGVEHRVSLASNDMQTHVDGVGSLRVLRGERIEISPARGVDSATLVSAIAGPGLAMLLHQRGLFVLHGSCVALGDGGVCFAGASGAGKSTLAAALHRRGCALISDGMTVLERQNGRAVALPGPRCTRLWPDAANHLGWRSDALSRVLPDHDKRVCPLPVREMPPAVELRGVLATSEGVPPRIDLLGPGAGVMELVKHAFLAEWVDAESAPLLLTQCAALAERLRVAALFRGSALGDVDAVARLLETWTGGGSDVQRA